MGAPVRGCSGEPLLRDRGGSARGNTPTALAGVGAGHQALPGRRRRDAEGALIGRERRFRVGNPIHVADARVVVEVVAEVGLAVAHVFGAVEHVRVPDLVDVGRSRDLLLRVRLAELEEAEIFVRGGAQLPGAPLGIVATHESDRSREIDHRFGCQRMR